MYKEINIKCVKKQKKMIETPLLGTKKQSKYILFQVIKTIVYSTFTL